MNEEEKKAIEYTKSELKDEKIRNDYKQLTGLYGNEEIETILNLIEKQQKEIEFQKDINKTEKERHKKTEKSLKGQTQKQNKIINKMAEKLVEDKEWFYSEFDNYNQEQFIEYFTNLVEKESK